MPEPRATLVETVDPRHEAWEVALDRIELDLVRAERAIESGAGLARVDVWREPDYYGPIPVSLRSRAEEILARQQRTMRRLTELLGVTAQHQAIVEGAAALSTPNPDLAVYVDVSA